MSFRQSSIGEAIGTERTGDLSPQALYLNLLKSALSHSLFTEAFVPFEPWPRTLKWALLKWALFSPVQRFLRSRGLWLTRRIEIGPEWFRESPPPAIQAAETLIGPVGLDNLQHCIEDVLERGIPGDLIETGVWRGGAVIFMRGVLAARGDATRRVWAADSFQGLPEPDPARHAVDVGDEKWAKMDWLAIPIEHVRSNFERYGLLDDRVQFLVGWFHETLPTAPIDQLAVMRLDGDMYGSTMDALVSLYPKLSIGGYVIVDDYWLPKCQAAVDDYRREHGITEEIVRVDRAIVYWRRQR